MTLAEESARLLRRAGVLLWRLGIRLEVNEREGNALDVEDLELSILELEAEIETLRKLV